MTDTLVIKWAYRPPINVIKSNGDVIVRVGNTFLHLSTDDVRQLHAFAADRPMIQQLRDGEDACTLSPTN